MTFTHKLKEPDIRNVAKKLVRVEKPCVAELSTLMDCMKRVGSSSDVDTGCSRERAALQACSQKMGATSVRAARGNMYTHMQRLVKSWKRFGY